MSESDTDSTLNSTPPVYGCETNIHRRLAVNTTLTYKWPAVAYCGNLFQFLPVFVLVSFQKAHHFRVFHPGNPTFPGKRELIDTLDPFISAILNVPLVTFVSGPYKYRLNWWAISLTGSNGFILTPQHSHTL